MYAFSNLCWSWIMLNHDGRTSDILNHDGRRCTILNHDWRTCDILNHDWRICDVLNHVESWWKNILYVKSCNVIYWIMLNFVEWLKNMWYLYWMIEEHMVGWIILNHKEHVICWIMLNHKEHVICWIMLIHDGRTCDILNHDERTCDMLNDVELCLMIEEHVIFILNDWRTWTHDRLNYAESSRTCDMLNHDGRTCYMVNHVMWYVKSCWIALNDWYVESCWIILNDWRTCDIYIEWLKNTW